MLRACDTSRTPCPRVFCGKRVSNPFLIEKCLPSHPIPSQPMSSSPRQEKLDTRYINQVYNTSRALKLTTSIYKQERAIRFSHKRKNTAQKYNPTYYALNSHRPKLRGKKNAAAAAAEESGQEDTSITGPWFHERGVRQRHNSNLHPWAASPSPRNPHLGRRSRPNAGLIPPPVRRKEIGARKK